MINLQLKKLLVRPIIECGWYTVNWEVAFAKANDLFIPRTCCCALLDSMKACKINFELVHFVRDFRCFVRLKN